MLLKNAPRCFFFFLDRSLHVKKEQAKILKLKTVNYLREKFSQNFQTSLSFHLCLPVQTSSILVETSSIEYSSDDTLNKYFKSYPLTQKLLYFYSSNHESSEIPCSSKSTLMQNGVKTLIIKLLPGWFLMKSWIATVENLLLQRFNFSFKLFLITCYCPIFKNVSTAVDLISRHFYPSKASHVFQASAVNFQLDILS